MSNQIEKSQAQLNAIDFKSLAEIPLFIAFIGICLGLVLLNVIPAWLGVVGSFGAILYHNYAAKQEALKEAKSRAASYANMIGPIVVGSDNPEENVFDVAEKAKAWRENLKLSGNPYADLLPIIEYPYSPMLYQVGQLSAGWSIYQKQLAETQHMENLKWYEGKCPAPLKGLFASAVLPSVQTTTV